MEGLEPELDLALLPVWGWGPRLGPGHLDPERAARAAQLLRPRIAVPIHWGTFYPRGRREGNRLTAPPREFAARVAELAPQVTVRVLQPGAALDADAARSRPPRHPCAPRSRHLSSSARARRCCAMALSSAATSSSRANVSCQVPHSPQRRSSHQLPLPALVQRTIETKSRVHFRQTSKPAQRSHLAPRPSPLPWLERVRASLCEVTSCCTDTQTRP